eukprot:COSAG01_NODE_10361_length_2184_cov_2.861391_3_plen_88_part_00
MSKRQRLSIRVLIALPSPFTRVRSSPSSRHEDAAPPPDLSDPSLGPAPWPQGHTHGPSRRNGPWCDTGAGTVRIAARARFDRRPALQ